MLTDYGVLRTEYKARFASEFVFVPPVTPDAVRELIGRLTWWSGNLCLAPWVSPNFRPELRRPVIASFTYPDAYPTAPPLCNAATADRDEAALEHLFTHQAHAQALGLRARDWVIANHGLDVLAERLARLYAALIERPDAHRRVAHAAHR